MKKYIKKVLNFLVILIITLLVLYFSLKDNYRQVIKEIVSINKLWLLLAFLLIIVYWFFKAAVIKINVSKFKKDYKFTSALRLVLETNFFHAVTPFASGGQPYEIYCLKKSGLKITDGTNVSIQNFIVYQIALVTLGIAAIILNFFLHMFVENSFLKYLVTLGFICNFLVIVGLFIISFTKKLNQVVINFFITISTKLHITKNKEKSIEKWNKYITEFNEGAKILIEDKKSFATMILLNFAALFCLYLIPLVLMYGTGDYTSMTAVDSIVSSAYVMLIGSFVPIPGGTGGLEYGFVVFFNKFIKGSKLNAIMLVWRFITYYFGMIVGAITLNFTRKKD